MSDSEEDWVDAEPNAPLQVPEWSCASTYACGRRFSAMTYAEMYQKVQDLHIASGGVHLDVHARPSDCKGGDMEVLPGSIQFYCPHTRDHGDKCGHKQPVNPSAARAERKYEQKRVYFNRENPCRFRFTVRRCKESPLPQQVCKPKHGHKNYMACDVKCDWFVDGEAKQKEEGRKVNQPVMSHNGHPRKTLPMGKITPEIRAYIEEQAKINVMVPSIAAGILEKFGCVITDSSLYHALTDYNGTEYVIDSLENQRFVKKKFANKTEAFLHSLRSCRDVSYVLLVENLEKSTETHVKYETWKRDFADGDDMPVEHLIDSEFEGDNKLQKPPKKKRADLREEEMNGRMYDTSRIIEIDNCKKFYLGVMYVQADELRMFEAFPEVLIMDSKAKTNDLRQAYFAGIGVDSFWLNNTLFRCWIPNQTDTAYMWMTTIALPALVPVRILKQVQSIFTDDDKVVNSGIKLLLGKDECFSDAEAYICGYHIVRNFHQEFGMGSKTKHKKGGAIQWLHPWQAVDAQIPHETKNPEHHVNFESGR